MGQRKRVWQDVRNNLTRCTRSEKNWAIRMEVNQSFNPELIKSMSTSGDLNRDGKKEHGIVNFFRDRVVSLTIPL